MEKSSHNSQNKATTDSPDSTEAQPLLSGAY